MTDEPGLRRGVPRRTEPSVIRCRTMPVIELDLAQAEPTRSTQRRENNAEPLDHNTTAESTCRRATGWHCQACAREEGVEVTRRGVVLRDVETSAGARSPRNTSDVTHSHANASPAAGHDTIPGPGAHRDEPVAPLRSPRAASDGDRVTASNGQDNCGQPASSVTQRVMTPQSIRNEYAAFVARQLRAGLEDPAGILEGSLDVLDDIIAGRQAELGADATLTRQGQAGAVMTRDSGSGRSALTAEQMDFLVSS